MTDDQATLGTFAEGEDDEADHEAAASGGSDVDPDGSDGQADAGAETTTESDTGDEDLVCPWCLASAESFVERGLTGLACGRCSAVLPTEAEWFHERDVVARRPMYEVGG